MKLTEKDKTFIESLKNLTETGDLWIDYKRVFPDEPGNLVLRGTYGQKIHKTFGMSRQGVRWRFQRLFCGVYVEAFETILFIEKAFGPGLRDHAIKISQGRYALRKEALSRSVFTSADRLAGSADAGADGEVPADE